MNTRKPVSMPLGDIEHMLEQWGLWRMDGMGVPSYVSPSWAIMCDILPSTSKSYAITDELAELSMEPLPSCASAPRKWVTWGGFTTAASGQPSAWGRSTTSAKPRPGRSSRRESGGSTAPWRDLFRLREKIVALAE